jgi:hypothetical protein
MRIGRIGLENGGPRLAITSFADYRRGVRRLKLIFAHRLRGNHYLRTRYSLLLICSHFRSARTTEVSICRCGIFQYRLIR